MTTSEHTPEPDPQKLPQRIPPSVWRHLPAMVTKFFSDESHARAARWLDGHPKVRWGASLFIGLLLGVFFHYLLYRFPLPAQPFIYVSF